MTTPRIEPQNVRAVFADGRSVPLLPVYLGKEPRDGEPNGEPVDAYTLWAHPDLPEDVVFTNESITVEADVIPPGCRMHVNVETTIVRRIPRHPG